MASQQTMTLRPISQNLQPPAGSPTRRVIRREAVGREDTFSNGTAHRGAGLEPLIGPSAGGAQHPCQEGVQIPPWQPSISGRNASGQAIIFIMPRRLSKKQKTVFRPRKETGMYTRSTMKAPPPGDLSFLFPGHHQLGRPWEAYVEGGTRRSTGSGEAARLGGTLSRRGGSGRRRRSPARTRGVGGILLHVEVVVEDRKELWARYRAQSLRATALLSGSSRK